MLAEMTCLYPIDDHLGTLIDAMELASQEDVVHSSLRAFSRAAHFQDYSYVCIRGSEMLTVSSLPREWQDLYIKRDYRGIDPVLETARRSMMPFSWTLPKPCPQNPLRNSFLLDAKRFGILSGFTIPVPTGFGQLTLLTMTSSSEVATKAVVHNTTRAIAAAVFVHASLLRSSSGSQWSSDVRLTGREKICLTWASFGKTHSETAQMIGIAQTTVRFYLFQAKEKLGAKNISHAVRLAVKNGII